MTVSVMRECAVGATAPHNIDYFISRTGKDENIAIAIAEIVREAGYSTWLQDENFGHASFMVRMEQGFDSGARVIALLSSGYQHSPYCRKEYNVTLTGDPLNLHQRLIVVRVDDCQPSGNLSDVPYTDLVPILAIADDEQLAVHFLHCLHKEFESLVVDQPSYSKDYALAVLAANCRHFRMGRRRERRYVNSVGNDAGLGCERAQCRRRGGVCRRGRDDSVAAHEEQAKDRLEQFPEKSLAHHVAVIGDHQRP